MNVKYTKEILEPIVKESFSYAEVLRKLKLLNGGGTYNNIKNRVEDFNIDTSHFKGQSWSTGKIFQTKHEYLMVYDNSKKISTDLIKKKIIRDNLKEYKCEKCGLSKWMGNPIPLEIHHKDGNRWNNVLDNIEFLCPNCHTFTDNYKGKKNKGKTFTSKKRTCIDCGKVVYYGSKRCKECENSKRRTSKDIFEIKKRADEIGVVATGKEYGVSHTTIRRWISTLT